MDKSPKKVLCIEDEHFISDLYDRALSKAGYNILVVLDGESGLREAMTNEYDLILLDLMIPGITGMEVLRQLRKEGGPKINAHIVITTNLDVKPNTRKELEDMADGYIIKAEITPHQLVDFVAQIVPPHA